MVEPLYDELQMKVHLLIQERDELLKEIHSIEIETPTRGQTLRIVNRVQRLKLLNERISKLGKRYNIVKVSGKYIIKSGKLEVGKYFEIYYTDISTEDARKLAEMNFEHGVFSIQAEPIAVGVINEQTYSKH